MATTLTLFPSRIRFTNADGTLTPEAYRALQTLVERSGGIMGDNGVDVFGDLTGAASQDSSVTYTVTQQANTDQAQPVSVDSFIPDVVQPENKPVAIASTAAPDGGVGTAAGGYDTEVNRDAAITLLNTIRTALIGVGILK